MRKVLLAGVVASLSLVVSAGAGASGPVASASGKLPALIANCSKAKVKPAGVILACADASFGATNMSWSSWTRKSALGTGTGNVIDCKPNCAEGKPKSAPIQLRLSKPTRCSNGRRIFTKVRWTWTQNAPPHFPTTGTTGLGCKLFNL